MDNTKRYFIRLKSGVLLHNITLEGDVRSMTAYYSELINRNVNFVTLDFSDATSTIVNINEIELIADMNLLGDTIDTEVRHGR
jgi:hypothetical protein